MNDLFLYLAIDTVFHPSGIFKILKSSPAALVLEFEMWWHFDTKQKSKPFTLYNCVWLCVIDCMVYPDPKLFLCLKLNGLIFFWGWKLIFSFYVITQGICNKFIKLNFCVGCLVSRPNYLLQDWTFVEHWWDLVSTSSTIQQ